MSPPSPLEPSAVVVLCQPSDAIPRIRERFPSLKIIDIAGGVPDGTRGDVLFGGFGGHAVDAMATGVRWVQMIGTGVDGTAAEVHRYVPFRLTDTIWSQSSIG